MNSRGYTLIELIVVIVIGGIIGGAALVFLKWPVQQYMDLSRRTELSYIADSASGRLADDIRSAVPDSIRVAGCGATPCVEFLQGRGIGHYRALPDGERKAGDALDFTVADGDFDIIGPPVRFAAGDYVVIGDSPYDETESGSLRAYAGAAGAQSHVEIEPVRLPAPVASQRFYVVDGTQQAVTYACEGVQGELDAAGDGKGQLVRHWAYGFKLQQAAPLRLAGARAILADKVSACRIEYLRPRLLAVHLTLAAGGERVELYREIGVRYDP